MLHFKGNRYNVAKLAKLTGPTITIEPSDIHPDNEELVEIKDGESDLTVVLFAKYESKYVVLTGYNTVKGFIADNQPIVGKLISNPTLKNAVVV